MKLRETIVNEDGSLTHPEGIYLVPNYALMFWLNMLLWLPCWGLSICTGCMAADEW
jgi:hypothetical protein